MASVLENTNISPSPDAPPEFSLPFTFLDMTVYDFEPPTPNVMFFEFPCSKSHFLDTIVPDLKASLSLTLTNFLPLAGNIIYPLNPEENKPIIRYEYGDSVSFTVSESNADFIHLTGNQPRSSDQFYDFVPQILPAKRSENSIICPILALQVTLFPDLGLSIGYTTHHTVVDGSTLWAFIQSWALINRTRTKDTNMVDKLTERNYLPFYDRKAWVNLNGLESKYWDLVVKSSFRGEPLPMQIPTNKVRSTFVLRKSEIQKLKELLLAKSPVLTFLSSYTVCCALFWVCAAKTAALGGEKAADDEPHYFTVIGNCRGRLNPPLPQNYFGCCLTQFNAKLKHGELKSPDGFVKAATAIGDTIKENMYGEKGVEEAFQKWPEELKTMEGKLTHWVTGSPKDDFYTADYGWGRSKKIEVLSIDLGDSVVTPLSILSSRHFEGGLEIGLSLTPVQMDAFVAMFNEVLEKLLVDSALFVSRL